MNRLCLRSLFMLLFTALLSGCYLNLRTWEICSITMPQLYCDTAAWISITKPKPSSNDWEKEGVSYVDGVSYIDRVIDWKNCGGDYTGSFDGFGAFDVGATEICMINEGYHYTGKCDTEIAIKFPGCTARNGIEN